MFDFKSVSATFYEYTRENPRKKKTNQVTSVNKQVPVLTSTKTPESHIRGDDTLYSVNTKGNGIGNVGRFYRPRFDGGVDIKG